MLKSEPALNAIIVFYLVLYTYGAVDVRIDYLVSNLFVPGSWWDVRKRRKFN